MDNLKLPASPFFDYNESGYGNALVVYDRYGGKQIWPFHPGFTKLEKAALMIAQGMLSGPHTYDGDALDAISTNAVNIAKSVLKAANI